MKKQMNIVRNGVTWKAWARERRVKENGDKDKIGTSKQMGLIIEGKVQQK